MQIDKIKFDYILDHFWSMYSNDIKDIVDIGYGSEYKIEIKQSQASIIEPSSNPDFYTIKGRKIPFFYDRIEDRVITVKDEGVIIEFDIIKNSFLFLSGIIDLMIDKCKDDIGRVLFKQSFFDKMSLGDYPIVNYYFAVLKEAIEQVYPIKLVPKFPTLEVLVSHDIDKCQSGWIEDGFYLLKKKKIWSFLVLQYNKWVRQMDPWFNFDKILELEKRFNIRSTFFFLAKKGKYQNYYNADYRYNSTALKKVYKRIQHSGSEVGIHGSFGSAVSEVQFTQELNRLNNTILSGDKISGNRFHFLCWDQALTSSVIENSGLKYDMTAAYPDQIGFKTGFCFPSQYFNLKENRAYSFFEVPLVVMDSTLYDNKYMALNEEEAFNKVQDLIEESREFNGIFSLLWHNTFYTDAKYNGKQALLWRIVRFCSTLGAEYNSVEKLIDQWKTKE